MTFLKSTAEAIVRLMPRALAGEWRARTDFRRELSRLAADPHLLEDVGFRGPAALAEVDRLPWEPVAIRRMGRAAPLGRVSAAQALLAEYGR